MTIPEEPTDDQTFRVFVPMPDMLVCECLTFAEAPDSPSKPLNPPEAIRIASEP